MEFELPKILFRLGSEPQIEKINNRCQLAILNKIKDKLKSEYEAVLSDPVFGPIISMHKNGLLYSGRRVHTFMCKQLNTDKKHELWFVFGRRPLRFSLQEFHAVTRLSYNASKNCNFKKWNLDGGFWSNLLQSERGISVQKLMRLHFEYVNEWERDDRLRLVYLCVIVCVVMAQDASINIPREYIILVMDLQKLRKYPWGLRSYVSR